MSSFRKICLYKIEDDSINLVAEDSLKQEMLETDVGIRIENFKLTKVCFRTHTLYSLEALACTSGLER